MTISARRNWRVTACATMLLMLQACARVSSGDFCLIYQPVYAAPKDTEETRRQIDDNNAAFLALCNP